jgi:hypothetical protein
MYRSEGNSVIDHAITREAAERIAAEDEKLYPGSSVSITGWEGTGPPPSQASDVRAIAEDNVSHPTYRVIFRDSSGSASYTAQTLQQAKKIAKKYRKYYPGNKVYLLTPKNELERIEFREAPFSTHIKSNNVKPTSHNLGALKRIATEYASDHPNSTVTASLPSPPPDEHIKTLTLTFRESPEMAMYKQIEKEEIARKAAEEAQEAVDDVMSTIPSYALISGLNKIGKEIESKAAQRGSDEKHQSCSCIC